METKYGFDNIEEFYKDLDNRNKAYKLHVYYSYLNQEERMNKEKDVADEMKWSGCTPSVTLVGEDMAVVAQTDRNYGTLYQPWVKGFKRNISYKTFDEALLACVSIKHTGVEFSADYMYKLIKE